MKKLLLISIVAALALSACAYSVPPAVTKYMDRGGNDHIALLDQALADKRIDQVTHDAEVDEIKAIQNLVKEASK